MKLRQVRLHKSQHLAEDQLRPLDPACPFCASEDRSTVLHLQENPDVLLLKCADCGAASASRIPKSAALDAYYQGYYVSPHIAADAERINFHDAQRFGRHLGKRAGSHLHRSSVRILDYGGGDGTVALRTADELLVGGYETVRITVIDFNTTLAETADERISLARHDTLDDLQDRDVDLVIASAVIEHLPEPTEALLSLLNLLSEGGIFYARTPYRVPFIRWFERLGIEWETMFPAHIHDLGQDFWEAFFGNVLPAGEFTLLESRPSIVESSPRDQRLRALVAYAFKAPWYILGNRYTLVGGWEILARRDAGPSRSVSRAT